MAPQMIETAASSAAKEFKKESATARLLGSGTPNLLSPSTATDFYQDPLVSQNSPYFTPSIPLPNVS